MRRVCRVAAFYSGRVSFTVSVGRTPEELLFDAPVGADGDVHQWWSHPATKLNLPLVSDLYKNGLQVSGDDLARLKEEMVALEKYWCEAVPSDEVRTYDILGRSVDVPLLAHLSYRADSVMAAIELAQQVDGELTIS